ncbi:hypothetical protein HK103_007491 [Boothiomyces macroporosus]|uniref:Uncharacterized protein n=1 Tax=Boothiomyces macroporosus TaxID=261099 RepID=A0AAD5UC14_9FUNG|nr:hypothetical protein HK103_007491 [Boothiomyces macroporosus]
MFGFTNHQDLKEIVNKVLAAQESLLEFGKDVIDFTNQVVSADTATMHAINEVETINTTLDEINKQLFATDAFVIVLAKSFISDTAAQALSYVTRELPRVKLDIRDIRNIGKLGNLFTENDALLEDFCQLVNTIIEKDYIIPENSPDTELDTKIAKARALLEYYPSIQKELALECAIITKYERLK